MRSDGRPLLPVSRLALDSLHNLPLPEPSLIAMAGGLLLQRLRPWPLPRSRSSHLLLGGLFIVAGTRMVVRATTAAGTVDLERPRSLVVTGPFIRTRNPMYESWLLLQVGFGLAVGSWWVLATIPVAAAGLHREVLREERRLEATFGQEFRDYCADVPRYHASTSAWDFWSRR